MSSSFSGSTHWWLGLLAGVWSLSLSVAARAEPTEQPAEPPPAVLVPAIPAEPAPQPAEPTNAPYPAEAYAPLPVTPAVAAESAPPAADTPRPYSVGATLSSSFDGETGSDTFLLSPLVEGAYAVHPRVLVNLALGFGWLVDNQGLGESIFRAGNPQLSGTYRETVHDWRLHASLGVTAPLAHIALGPDGRLQQSLYNRTLAVAGMWNQWLWLADRMAVPVQARGEYQLPLGAVIKVEMAVALVFGVTNGATGTNLVGQAAVEAQIAAGRLFSLCPRLQTVLLPSGGIDRSQTAIVMRGLFSTRAGRYFGSVLFNLDEPLGVLGAGQRWGFHVGKEMDL